MTKANTPPFLQVTMNSRTYIPCLLSDEQIDDESSLTEENLLTLWLIGRPPGTTHGDLLSPDLIPLLRPHNQGMTTNALFLACFFFGLNNSCALQANK